MDTPNPQLGHAPQEHDVLSTFTQLAQEFVPEWALHQKEVPPKNKEMPYQGHHSVFLG